MNACRQQIDVLVKYSPGEHQVHEPGVRPLVTFFINNAFALKLFPSPPLCHARRGVAHCIPLLFQSSCGISSELSEIKNPTEASGLLLVRGGQL